ncbi:NACHT domain-containing protein [candidate division KSB3 bacterium]|uniref:NACHT domain-containing protein n=1 Tax=candidate division KSB3 bacterium TaxID=2044937 RepID=A0A9D5Q611_9BACT|nr:NACHT domain-containing protein [candidate division KSB3 bacterium]MBD3324928.1 NACHT domain-containing protein [candidate division KSB3 bacterium]
MGTTLQDVISKLNALQLDDVHGAAIFLKGIDLLVDYIDFPWREMMQRIFPAAPFVTGFLRQMQAQHPEEFDLHTYAALAIQHAYLDAFQSAMNMAKLRLDMRFDLNQEPIPEQQRQALHNAIEQFREVEIDVTQIDFPHLHESSLVRDYLETISVMWLQARVFRHEDDAYEVANRARQISDLLYPHLLQILVEYGDFYAPLTEYVDETYHRELQRHGDVERYRASLMRRVLKPLFHEPVTLSDVYVELDATDSTRKQKFPESVRFHESFREITEDHWQEGKTSQLLQTVLDHLEAHHDQVLFIQGDPGSGKTTFCHLLAATVAAERLEWLPVLICLRDFRFDPKIQFEDGVKQYLAPSFTLTDALLRTRRVLFILDGFDQLHFSADPTSSLQVFFDHLACFQKTCAAGNRVSHKVLVTGRSSQIQDIESDLPANFLRLKIEQMGTSQVEAWVSQWATLWGESTATEFQTFLEHAKVLQPPPDEPAESLATLAHEPLVLYMLAAMARGGVPIRELLETPTGRTDIYDRFVSWVCGDTRTYYIGYHTNRLLEQSAVSPPDLRRFLQEAAFFTWHSGQEGVPINQMSRYLGATVPETTRTLLTSGFDGIQNQLLSFPFPLHDQDTRPVTFCHKTFREYLAAEKIAEVLKDLGQSPQSPSAQLNDIRAIAARIYAVFGTALLTEEIRTFVLRILTHTLSPQAIRQIAARLYPVYLGYSDGLWMNEGLSRTQANELRRHGVHRDVLQCEVYAGINLFVFLCHLYQEIGEPFDICGREQDGTFDPNRFRKILGFGELIGTFALFRRIHHLLGRVRLRGANLLCANLRRGNLEGADLEGVILRDANLRSANVRGANLQHADLRVANLQDADFRDVDLRGANLEDANLRETNFQQANLQEANLLCADLRNADLQDAQLQKTVLYGVNLRGANLQGADVTDAMIPEQHLTNYRHLFSPEQLQQLHIIQD